MLSVKEKATVFEFHSYDALIVECRILEETLLKKLKIKLLA